MTTETVVPFMKADPARMREHLDMLFGRALSGRIEITAIRTEKDERGQKIKARSFPVDEIEEAVNYAVELNSVPQWNVYVGAAVRADEAPPFGRADDDDISALYALFADADDATQLASAKTAYAKLGIKPPFIVITGRAPETRAQMWWPLEDPITDREAMRASLSALAAALGTDPAPTAPSQLMRLAGGIAWPKPKPGRVLELVDVKQPFDAQPTFHIEQINRACPTTARALPVPTSETVVIEEGSGPLGMGEEKLADGREGFAFRLTRAFLHEYIGTTGAAPTPDELYALVAPVYFRKIVASPERGPTFLADKCRAAVRAFERGQIPFCRDLDHGVMEYQARIAAGRGAPSADPFVYEAHDAPTARGDDVFELLSIADIRALPEQQWVVKGAIPKNGLGFIYGAPGSFKTFVCYDLALSLAYGHAEWMGREVEHKGAVLYIASEGAAGFKNRITAWQIKNGTAEDSDKFRLIRRSMSFMDNSDVDRLERTVEAMVEATGPVDTIFVDTVSRVLPGADENLQKDMTIFIAACDRLRERFGAVVIGVHHTGKDGETMRGSTVFNGQGDFIFKCQKDSVGKSGVLTCDKQKEGEDGWQVAFDVVPQSWTNGERIETVTSLSIAFKGAPTREDDADTWPSKEVCLAVLKGIHNAWNKGSPWSTAPQTMREGRHAARNISAMYAVKASVASMMVEEWLRNEILSVDVVNQKTKMRGLKVENWPEWVAEVGGSRGGYDA